MAAEDVAQVMTDKDLIRAGYSDGDGGIPRMEKGGFEMRIYTKKEWDRLSFKGVWEDSPAFKALTGIEKIPAGHIGRRYVMVSGPDGGEYQTEGIHFLVEGDYSHLPVLEKANAMEGACYQFSGGYILVTEIYRLSEEDAREHELYYLDRASFVQHAEWGTVPGDCALPGSDVSEYFKNN